MKIIAYLLVLILFSCKSTQEQKSTYEVTSKKELLFNNYKFLINKVISDSRCPEGTNCIWAGELIVEVSVWQENKLIETSVLTFSPKTSEENLAWFSKFVSENKKVKSYKISPIKTEKSIELKDYKIELVLE